MRQLILAITGAGGVFLLAGALRNRGWALADEGCVRGAVLCDNPGGILAIVAALLFIATIQSIAKT